MNAGKTYDEKIVGVLHDVIEDCPEITLNDLLEEGFPNHIVFAIECLTKTPADQDYTEFVKQTEKSPLAVSVKMNDLADNMDLKRFTEPLTNRDFKRLNKYLTAYLILKFSLSIQVIAGMALKLPLGSISFNASFNTPNVIEESALPLSASVINSFPPAPLTV